ncbi:unnamed protein product [Symbiodinium natans]|uniref:Pseudouridine synthase RsuA/RluA-like domain-containing protein n=1 Tax=Symbiodinium natans TaxID=878477 RepID=A0A812U4S6_9DINO|nr:unnamed protein product [Symbiodinium natans]
MEQAGMETTVVSFNAIASAAASAKHWRRALVAASARRDAGIPGDAVGQTSLFQICKELQRWELAVHHLHTLQQLQVQVNHIHSDVVLTTLVQESWRRAVALLKELYTRHVELDAPSRRSLLRTHWQQALAQMTKTQSLCTDLPSATSFTAACSAAGAWTQALASCERSKSWADRICFNSAARAFERAGPWPFAVQLFSAPAEEEPDATGLASAQLAASDGGAWRATLLLLENAMHQALRPHLLVSAFDPGALRSAPGLWPQALESIAVDCLDLPNHADEFVARAEGLQEASKWTEACGLLLRLATARANQANSWRVAIRSLAVAMAAAQKGAAWHRSLAALRDARRRGLRAVAIHESCGVSACEKGLRWEGACEMLGLMPSRRMSPRAQGSNAAITACAKSEQWPVSLRWVLCMSEESLIPDEMSFGSFICAAGAHAWRQVLGLLLRFDPLNSLWSPTFFPWALAKMGCRTPSAAAALVHAAQGPLTAAEVAAFAWAAAPWHSVKRVVMCSCGVNTLGAAWRFISLCGLERSKANFGVFGPGIAKQLEKHALQCRGKCTYEELRIIASSGAALSLGHSFFRVLAEEVERRLPLKIRRGEGASGKDWQDLLGILRALHSVGFLPRLLHQLAEDCLRLTADDVESASAMPGPDPVVLQKPVGWEVYDGHGPLQLRDEVLRSVGNCPIFYDASRDYGFIHRLDVPSSGLILAAKTYRTHSYLQLQLQTGSLLREYIVLSHGWLPPIRRRISASLDDEGETTYSGIGKAALSKLKVQVQCHRHGKAMSAVAIQLGTGRKHQIRSHMAHIGHPVARDGRYSSIGNGWPTSTHAASSKKPRLVAAQLGCSLEQASAKQIARHAWHRSQLTTTADPKDPAAVLSQPAGILQQLNADVRSWNEMQPEAYAEEEVVVRVAAKGDRRVVYARLMAVRALAPLAARGNKKAIDAVVAGLKDQHISVREGAMEVLAKIAEEGDSVDVGQLSARLTAVKALAEAPDAALAAAALGSCLEDWHAAVQKAATSSLQKFVGKGGSDPAASTAIEAFGARALCGDRAGLVALLTALERDDASPTWRQALGALVRAALQTDSARPSELAVKVKPTITVLIQCYCAGFSIASVHYGSVVQLAASVECHVLDCHVAVAAASCELTNCPTIPAASRPRDEGWQHAGWSARSMGQAAGERLQVAGARLLQPSGWQKALADLNKLRRNRISEVRSNTAVITHCGKTAHWLAALDLLSGFAHLDLEPNVITFSSMVSALSGSQWELAVNIHEKVKEGAAQPDIILHNSVLNSFQELSTWELAQSFLSPASLQPTIVTYSTAVCMSGKNDRWPEALILLAQLPGRRLQLNMVGVGAAITACAHSAAWARALLLLGDPRRRAPNLIAFNAALGACEKAGQWRQVVLLLSRLASWSLEPDEITYNSAISACEKGGQWQRALRIMEMMWRKNLQLSVVTYSAAVSACEKRGEWQTALLLLKELEETGQRADLILISSAISACEKRSKWAVAALLLESTLNSGLEADAIIYNAAISACEKEQWALALCLYEDAKTQQLELNVVTLSATISACEKGGRWQHVLRLLQDMEWSWMQPNIVTFNAAISACELSSQWQHSLALLGELRRAILQPDTITLEVMTGLCEDFELGDRLANLLYEVLKEHSWSVLVALALLVHSCAFFLLEPTAWHWLLRLALAKNGMCCSTGTSQAKAFTKSIQQLGKQLEWQNGMHVLDEFKKSRCNGAVNAYSAGITACGRAEEWQRALLLFAALQEITQRPNVVAYTSAISACERASEWRNALVLLQQAEHAAVEADVIMYNAVCSACQKGSDWHRAVQLCHMLVSRTLEPTIVSHSTVISAWGRAGRWQRALRLYQDLPLLGMKLNNVIYGALLSACEASSRWQEALDLLTVEAESLVNLIIVNTAISACEKAAEWQAALLLLSDLLASQSRQPDQISFNSAISACEKAGQWQWALELLRQLGRNRLQASVVSYSAALSACEKGSVWLQAMLLLSTGKERKLQFDVVAYSALVSACSGDSWQMAVRLLADLRQSHVCMDLVTCNAASSACAEGRSWLAAAAERRSVHLCCHQRMPAGVECSLTFAVRVQQHFAAQPGGSQHSCCCL